MREAISVDLLLSVLHVISDVVRVEGFADHRMTMDSDYCICQIIGFLPKTGDHPRATRGTGTIVRTANLKDGHGIASKEWYEKQDRYGWDEHYLDSD